METYHVIGLMSGTSVDGVDLAHCRFDWNGTSWQYEILHADTISYPADWRNRLNGLYSATAVEYARTHAEYGHYLGGLVKHFMNSSGIKKADAVASHGHTIFHRPADGFTAQVGEGASISAGCGLPVICDFRMADVAFSGQGAPLVPVGDRLLFGEYTHCLNLGGIANISFEEGASRLAFDVCACNFLLNRYASEAGMEYDRNGDLARTGHVVQTMLDELNAVSYFKRKPPKSLGREEMESLFIPVIQMHPSTSKDTLCTLSEHIALKVSAAASGSVNMLVSGGGAWNGYLVERIRFHVKGKVTVPDPMTVNFREALIFAFLGVLRLRGEANCLSTVTGAVRDVCGGAVYRP